MDGALVVDVVVFAGEGTVHAGSVGNGLAIAFGEPADCAVDSFQNYIDD